MTYWEDSELIDRLLYHLLYLKDALEIFSRVEEDEVFIEHHDDFVLLPLWLRSIDRDFRLLFWDNDTAIFSLWGEDIPHRGLTKRACDSFPETSRADEKCSICHDDLDKCIQLPCRHSFHKNCIVTWFDKKNTCPNCRVEFIENTNNTLTIKC